MPKVLGTDLTDTLMAYLPTTPAGALATWDDTDGLWTAIRELKKEIRLLSQPVDRFQHTLVAGFLWMTVALLLAALLG